MDAMRFSRGQIRSAVKFMRALSGADIQAKGLSDVECYHIIAVYQQFAAIDLNLKEKKRSEKGPFYIDTVKLTAKQINAMRKFMGRVSGKEIMARGLSENECAKVVIVWQNFKDAADQIESKGKAEDGCTN